MNITVMVTDGVAALYRECCGEEWQSAMQEDVVKLNRLFVEQSGSNVLDYPADDFPFVEYEIDCVAVMFRIQGRGVPPQFILAGEWERLVNPPPNRSDPFPAWHATFMDFDIPDACD